MARFTSDPAEIEHLRKISQDAAYGHVTFLLKDGRRLTGLITGGNVENNHPAKPFAMRHSLTLRLPAPGKAEVELDSQGHPMPGQDVEIDLLDVEHVVPRHGMN